MRKNDIQKIVNKKITLQRRMVSEGVRWRTKDDKVVQTGKKKINA